jgi:hypothetical protein
MTPTEVFDTYWRFVVERQAIYERRLTDPRGPWTADPILQQYKFTNVFRAADRVSQHLIREVQYRVDRSQAPVEVVFRTLLFKFFNRIETWELLERTLGPLSWQSTDLSKVEAVLDAAMIRGERIYSAAYIMPAPALGRQRKHANHLALLTKLMADGLPGQIATARSLREVYERLLAYPGLGPFLAFQYSIDLNYSSVLAFDEDEFVIAGPGALDGLAKCFDDLGGHAPEEAIAAVVDDQEREFAARGLDFSGLFGRRMRLIDAQNVFCEISKYARIAHPGVRGVSHRTRIKQNYRPSCAKLVAPTFPPRWGLRTDAPVRAVPMRGLQKALAEQGLLL